MKLDSPSFHRNIAPVEALLTSLLEGAHGSVLEIGSGSGQHVARLAALFPGLTFQPSEMKTGKRASIDAYAAEAALGNIRPAIQLDVRDDPWPFDKNARFDLFTAFNVIHIAPWNVTQGLFAGAARHSDKGARVFLYGPFKRGGQHTSESNADFERWLQEKDAAFGVRDIHDVSQVAKDAGFTFETLHPMPANNFMAEFVRT